LPKVLIISPRFPPSNAPDLQRVRLALPFFAERGWEATVVCVDASCVSAPFDPLLASTIPAEIVVHRVQAFSARWTRLVGVGSLAVRSYYRLATIVDRLLKEQKFDLIYFSTTEFGLLPLGPRWLSKFGVPYVVDLQDPWVNHYYRENQIRPPGGYLKHRIHQWFAAKLEPQVLRNANAIMVVSKHYAETLCQRYPFLDPARFVAIPFAATLKDIEVASSASVANRHFDKADGRKHWVYVGRCGPDMDYSLRCLLGAFRRYTDAFSKEGRQLKMHFIGTDYAAAGSQRFWVKPIANELGLGDLVEERPGRIPYFEALRCLIDADAVIVPGSSDPTYTASKIYPYIAVGRPMLTVFNEQSSVNDVVRSVRAGVNVTFCSSDSILQTVDRIYEHWFVQRGFDTQPLINTEAFSIYLAPAMTDRIVDCFATALELR
jgi:hypothetical protein